MPVVLRCDAPLCVRETAGVWQRGVLAPPKPWYLQTTSDGRTVCACDAAHLNAALAAGAQLSTPDPEA